MAILASDELRRDIIARFGQRDGIATSGFERVLGDGQASEVHPAVLDALEGAMDRRPGLHIFDGGGEDGEPWTVERATSALLQFAKSRGPNTLPVLIVDTAQTVYAAGTDGAEPRMRVNAVFAALRRAKMKGVLVVALSEVARGQYGPSEAPGKRGAPNRLGGAKESGSAEYAGGAVFHLEKVGGDSTDRLLTAPKIKNGADGIEARVRLEKRGVHWSEVELGDAAPESASTMAAERAKVEHARDVARAQRKDATAETIQAARVEQLRQHVVTVLRDAVTKPTSVEELKALVGGNRQAAQATIAKLKSEGVIAKAPGNRGAFYVV